MTFFNFPIMLAMTKKIKFCNFEERIMYFFIKIEMTHCCISNLIQCFYQLQKCFNTSLTIAFSLKVFIVLIPQKQIDNSEKNKVFLSCLLTAEQQSVTTGLLQWASLYLDPYQFHYMGKYYCCIPELLWCYCLILIVIVKCEKCGYLNHN